MKFKRINILSNWEYWPSFMFYIPVVPYAFYLALKARNLVYFSATNPAIKHSGNGSESKYQTLELIPVKYRPKSIFIKRGSKIDEVHRLIEQNEISFPMIAKPDIGFRGLLVRKIETDLELITYCERHKNLNLIVQEYVDFTNECGIFYHKMPNKKRGNISSITLKEFLKIRGDGESTLSELIHKHPRAKRYIPYLHTVIGHQFDSILKNGEEKILTTIGNHSKGTKFINGNFLIDEELKCLFDKLFEKIPGFYYGRVDLKFESIEALKKGKHFKILEINGIISEPTHIYDPLNASYFDALRAIRYHWKIMQQIAVHNHRINQVPYDRISHFVQSLYRIKKHKKNIKNLSQH